MDSRRGSQRDSQKAARRGDRRNSSQVAYAPLTPQFAQEPTQLPLPSSSRDDNTPISSSRGEYEAFDFGSTTRPRLSLHTGTEGQDELTRRVSEQVEEEVPYTGSRSALQTGSRGLPPHSGSPWGPDEGSAGDALAQDNSRTSTKGGAAFSIGEDADGDSMRSTRDLEAHPRGTRPPAWKQKEKVPNGIQERFEKFGQTFRRVILRQSTIEVKGEGRQIAVDVRRGKPLFDVRTNRPYINNTIRSSKYTYWSFLPRQIFFQFSKLANVYFLCISILQLIPGLSTTGTYTTIIPLMIFISISMGKEGYEDLRRHRLDKSDNLARVTRASRGNSSGVITWETLRWEQLTVGDIVRIKRDEQVPADVILLHADGVEDLAYVETMALDGETNLKNRSAPAKLAALRQSADQILLRNDISVHAEEPNLDLYNFQGNVHVGSEKQPLSNNEIIYRGSILRNTTSIIGLVVYSGEECKIRMNATKSPRIKAPRMQAIVNKVVLFIVVLVIMLSLGLSIAYIIDQPHHGRAFYLKNAQVNLGPIFIGFVIMLNTMIPLSLYVSMEIIKLWQIALMMNDREMYDEVTNTPMEARTSTINEELGQVSYVFSDKTGTLTDNVMKFRKVSVGGTAWRHDSDLDQDEASLKGEKTIAKAPVGMGTNSPLSGKTDDLVKLIIREPNTPFARNARFFLLLIALCHTCMSEKVDGTISYQATSPDEVALVQAAQEMGFIFIDRKAGAVTIRIPSDDGTGSPVEQVYTVLHVLDFTSKRKRMSLLVRMPDSRVCVVSKGADSTIKQLLRHHNLAQQTEAKVERRATLRKSIEAHDYMRRKSVQQARYSFARASRSWANASVTGELPIMSPTSPIATNFQSHRPTTSPTFEADADEIAMVTSPTMTSAIEADRGASVAFPALDTTVHTESSDEEIFEKCFQHIDYFATEGLRTLLYAYRYVGDEEFARWSRLYHDASTSLTNRPSRMDSVAALIETDLELSGATAIEDKLQDGVPLTIDRMRRAGIKVWVLTGDKRETAINIGKSCQLLKDFSEVAILDHEAGDLFLQIQSALTQMRNAAHSVIVVDGASLALIEEDASLFDFFHALAVFVDSVLCCRASPAQKASLVRAIRTRVPGSVTLAIGDGSNDVAMLQEAHVGIGITGREGLQAARSSDYSIAQFRFLGRLLLVHGRYNYVRVCKYTLGTFWKEMLFFLTQAMFQRYNGYTGTSLYESVSLSMFNTLFTSLPVIFVGIFEQDLAPQTLLAVPELYNFGQRSRGFSLRLYLAWSLSAAATAALIFWLALTLYGQAPYQRDASLYALGTLCFTAAVVVINAKLQFWEIRYKTVVALACLLIEVGGWFAWTLLLSALYKDNATYKVRLSFIRVFGRDGLWWLTLLLIVAMCFCLEVAVKMVRELVAPTDVDLYQRLEKEPRAWKMIVREAERGSVGGAGSGGDDDDDDDHALLLQRPPPQRSRTWQERRDAEYVSLMRSGEKKAAKSEGVRGRIVRFIGGKGKSSGWESSTATPARAGTREGKKPSPLVPFKPRSESEVREDIEMASLGFTPVDYDSPRTDYFANRDNDGGKDKSSRPAITPFN